MHDVGALLGQQLPGAITEHPGQRASLIVVVLMMGGLQLMGIGILGEYIGRIFEEVKQRPVYLVRERFRVDGEDDE